MFKNLSPWMLGVSGRQSELLELALTHGFRGLDVEISDLQKRAETQGVQQAKRFLESAKLQIGGFELPVCWTGDEAAFAADLKQLEKTAEFAQAIGARDCFTNIFPASDQLPYHENFELHRRRLQAIAAMLERHQMRLGLGILAAGSHRVGRDFQFIYQPDQLLLLIKTCGAANLGVALDTWDWFVGEGTLDQIRALKAEQIVTVRLADLPADADIATLTDDQRLLPTEASVDITAVITHLAEINYEGPVTAYAHPSQNKGMKREAIVQKVSAVLDEQWKLAGLSKTGNLETAAAS